MELHELVDELWRKRNALFSQFRDPMLQLSPTAAMVFSSYTPLYNASPINVQINLNIPFFQGKIDADALDNLL